MIASSEIARLCRRGARQAGCWVRARGLRRGSCLGDQQLHRGGTGIRSGVQQSEFGGHISTIAISPAPSAGATTILAGAGNGVYRSLDHGATWTPASFGLFGAPSVLRADPKTPGVVYAVGGGTSLVKTTRNGDTWLDTDGAQTLNSGAIDAAVDPMRPAIIYACGYAAALFRTADGGATWQKLTGFPLGCSHITIDPIATSNVYALAYEGTNNRGVYRSRDSGVTWIPVNTGLTSPDTLRPARRDAWCAVGRIA